MRKSKFREIDMKKALIIIPIVVVVVAAVVIGLFAAGIIGKKTEEPVAYAVDASATDTGVFKGLPLDTFFDIRANRDPSTSLDNFVILRDNEGNKVPLQSARQGDGVYRITARDGLKPRSSYQIWATGSTFAADQYKDLDTFIFMTAGEEVEKVTVNPDLKETTLAGTTVETLTQNGKTYYNVVLSEAADARYQPGDVILAKKPAQGIFDENLSLLYSGEIPGYEYNGMAAYTVLRESQVKDGREEIYCRLAEVSEVVTDIDIYKNLPITEENFSVDEAALQAALEESEFTAAVYEAALEAFDLFSGEFEKTVKDSPKMVAKFAYDVDMDKIQLDFYFIITLAKGVDITFAVKNTINLTPNVNCDYDFDGTDLDLQLDLGVNIKTKTVCSVEMETSDAKIQATTMEDFKKKFTELVQGKTAEKGIVGAELPIYSYKYPIYCFVLGIEFGVDIDLGIKAQIDFEYVYNTDITAGVTYVNGELNSYKSMETSSTAEDLVILGKLRAEAGVYVKVTASLLEVAGVGFKVSTGAYAEIAGQLRLDMKAALQDKTLHIIKGYYVTGGLYLKLGFEVKAGVTLPVVGWKGWEKSWTPAKWDFPLFEYGSKYLVQSFVDDEMEMEIQGKTAEFKTVKVNAFDIDKVADAQGIEVSIDSFDVEYLDDAADYITFEDGVVTVNPTIGTAFTAKVKLTAKSDSYVTAIVTFTKAAVMPTCEVTTQNYDKINPADLVFDVKRNQSIFVKLTGENVTESDYLVSAEGALTLRKAFLAKLSVGEHTFTYVTDKGRVYLTVKVIDSTPIAMKNGYQPTKTYLKSAKQNLSFPLTLNGSTVTEVEGLQKGEYSVDSTGTVVIYSKALFDKEQGAYDYRVVASNGTDLTLTVTVTDDRQPVLYASSFAFGKNAGVKSDVVVRFESYGYSLISVTGGAIQTNHYTADKSSLTIRQAYLADLNQGTYSFKLKFSNGTYYPERTVQVSVQDSATIVAALPTATYDKAAPADVTFKVYATAALTLAGNGIGDKYAYDKATGALTLPANYLKDLSEGTYVFTAKAGSSTASLTLTVVDTTEPEIESAEGGVMTIEYDKAQPGDRFFEMLLASATFDKVDGNGITAANYTLSDNAAKGTKKVTFKAAYLDGLHTGDYEFSVMTSVNVSTLIIKVVDTRKPEPIDQTSIAYTLGSGMDVTVNFTNYEHGIKAIEVKGGDPVSLYGGDCDFDRVGGSFTLKSDYLDTLPANTYVTVLLTFDDAAATTLSVTLAVSGS